MLWLFIVQRTSAGTFRDLFRDEFLKRLVQHADALEFIGKREKRFMMPFQYVQELHSAELDLRIRVIDVSNALDDEVLTFETPVDRKVEIAHDIR